MAKKCELLCPSQNFKSLDALIGNKLSSEYVDLATYFGVEIFNMRMHAQNISLKDLKEFVQKAHENNIKAYLATNIIIYENELKILRELIEKAYSAEIDGIIAHDFATIKLAKELNIPFHVSTQLSISNSIAAKFYEELGANRIILARELTLTQISEISKKLNKTKIECFVHGAMCTSISGRCYFSQTICESPDYSANRGKCLQPCRHKWRVIYLGDPNKDIDSKSNENTQNNNEITKMYEFDYDGFYFLNAKDLCMIEYLPQMLDAGIYGFKIEGRMRDAYYIDITSQVYFNALHQCFTGEYSLEMAQKWKRKLMEVYNRGFSTGFYFSKPISQDIDRIFSGNKSLKKKSELGRVVLYYRNKNIAKIALSNGKLSIGDEIIIEGGQKGPYYCIKVESMFDKNKMINETPNLLNKDSKQIYLITIKLPENCIVKKNNRVFKFDDNL